MSLRISRLQGGLALTYITAINFETCRDNNTLDGDKVYVIDSGSGKGKMYFLAGPGDVVYLDTLEMVPTFPLDPVRDLIYCANGGVTPQVGVWNGKEPVNENFRILEMPVCTIFQRSNDRKFSIVIEDAMGGPDDPSDLSSIEAVLTNHLNNAIVHLPTSGAPGQVLARGIGNTWTWMDWPGALLEQILNLYSSQTDDTIMGTAGEAILKGQTVGIGSDSFVYPVKAATQDECLRYVGIAINDTVAIAGQQVPVAIAGAITLESASFVPGKPVYLDTTTTPTQDDPLVTPRFSYHYEIGVALTTNTILLRRGDIIKL